MHRFRLLVSLAFLALALPARAADGFWSELGPPALTAPCSVYDPGRDRFVLYGGTDGNRLRDDVWVLDAAGTSPWRKLAVAGTPPFRVVEPVAQSVTVSGACWDPL